MKESFENFKNPFEYLRNFIQFETMKSSGPGGQHVSKKETKIRARLSLKDIEKNLNLTDQQKENLKNKFLKNYIEAVSQESRSQLENKENAVQKIFEQLNEALEIPKERKKITKESPSAKEKRISEKKRRSRIKKLREKPKPEEF